MNNEIQIGTEAVHPCRRDFQNRLKLQPIVPTKALRTNVLPLKGTCQTVAMLALPRLLVGQALVGHVLCADVLPGRDVHLDVAFLCPTKSLPFEFVSEALLLYVRTLEIFERTQLLCCSLSKKEAQGHRSCPSIDRITVSGVL